MQNPFDSAIKAEEARLKARTERASAPEKHSGESERIAAERRARVERFSKAARASGELAEAGFEVSGDDGLVTLSKAGFNIYVHLYEKSSEVNVTNQYGDDDSDEALEKYNSVFMNDTELIEHVSIIVARWKARLL